MYFGEGNSYFNSYLFVSHVLFTLVVFVSQFVYLYCLKIKTKNYYHRLRISKCSKIAHTNHSTHLNSTQCQSYITQNLPLHQHIIPPHPILHLTILPVKTTLTIRHSLRKPPHKLLPSLQVQRALPRKTIAHELTAV
jgi:hypothetical protein